MTEIDTSRPRRLFFADGARSFDKLAFTVAEACAATGIGRTSLYELIAEKRLKAFKAGGRRLILRADLEAFLKSCRGAA